MRNLILIAALLACAVPAPAQTPAQGGAAATAGSRRPNRPAPPQRQPSEEQLASLAEVPSNTPVVTLKGICNAAKHPESDDCKTVFTRAEMDRIVSTMTPGAPNASPRQIVIDHVRMLAAAALAQDRKLENNPAVAKELEGQDRLGGMRVLARAFYKQIEDDAGNPSMAEMQQYYAEHSAEFEEGEVWRLSLPKIAVSNGGRRIDPATLLAVMDGLHRQAVAGFNFDQIQLQAYKDLGLTQAPPPTMLTAARRSNLSPDEAKVFDLQPGDVSPVIESYTGLVILKLVSKRTAPLDSVIPEIRSDLKPFLFKREIENASKNIAAEFNLAYLGISKQPVLFPFTGDTLMFSEAANFPDARKRTTSRRRLPASPARTPLQPQSSP